MIERKLQSACSHRYLYQKQQYFVYVTLLLCFVFAAMSNLDSVMLVYVFTTRGGGGESHYVKFKLAVLPVTMGGVILYTYTWLSLAEIRMVEEKENPPHISTIFEMANIPRLH